MLNKKLLWEVFGLVVVALSCRGMLMLMLSSQLNNANQPKHE